MKIMKRRLRNFQSKACCFACQVDTGIMGQTRNQAKSCAIYKFSAARLQGTLNPFIAAKRQQGLALRPFQPGHKLEAGLAHAFLLILKWVIKPIARMMSTEHLLIGHWCIAALLLHALATTRGRTDRPGSMPKYHTHLSPSRKAPGKPGVSKYRGVSWHKSIKKWASQIRINIKVS